MATPPDFKGSISQAEEAAKTAALNAVNGVHGRMNAWVYTHPYQMALIGFAVAVIVFVAARLVL
jgi:hypothetical protein